MALFLDYLPLFLMLVTPVMSFLFGHIKVLSPSSNVHVDVVNHLNSALDSHSSQFHHSWRDYLLIFLVLALIIFFVYRRLVATFARRSPHPPLDAVVTSHTTGKY